MTLGFLSGSRNFFLWSFCLARICLDPLGGPVLHHDCISVIVSRFAIVTEDLLICCYQVTKFFCTRYGSAIASSARGPCNCGPLTDLAISVFREMSINTVLTQILTSLGCGLQRYFMWRTGVWVSSFRNSFIHKIFLWILAATPGFQHTTALHLSRQTRGFFVLSWFLRHLVWDFWLAWEGTKIGTKQRVSPFYHLFNIWTWHRHWRRINSTLILSFSSLTVAWCCRSWWRKRAWGRCRMMTLLSWKCHWGWRMKTGGRTRWKAWNQDRNEVLRVALYPNPVLNEMWFLTVDSFIRISVFMAKLSER